MTSYMVLDGVASFLLLKDVTNICKHMRRSRSIGGSSSLQWRKVGLWRSWRLQICSRVLLRVRIEIDQLQCVNCWVIIHCLPVSCTKINHSRFELVIWSSLQLSSKQWIITQQFMARADLFLKYCIRKMLIIKPHMKMMVFTFDQDNSINVPVSCKYSKISFIGVTLIWTVYHCVCG